MHNKIITFTICLLFSGILIFLAGCSETKPQSSSEEMYIQYPAIGKKIPQFDNLEGTDGNYHSISEFEGKPLLLMFETVECPFCEKERPSIQKLEKIYIDQLQVVTISIGEDMEEVLPHLQEKNIEHLWLLEGEQFVSLTYLTSGTPDHFFVDANGILISRVKGYMEYEQLEENIMKILK